jgi:hypothetical protein
MGGAKRYPSMPPIRRMRRWVSLRPTHPTAIRGPSASLRATGSRERAPDDRLREAIHFTACGGMDCFAALAMTSGYSFAISRRDRPRFASSLALLLLEGAGKTGRAPHPRSRVPNAQTKVHTSIQVRRKHSGLPCAMALRLTSCSSRRTALLPPSPPRSFASLGLSASTAAPEPHDFAVRFTRARLRALRVHRISPRVRDDRERPSSA